MFDLVSKKGGLIELKHYDVIIIGAGIIGSFIARELSKYELDILVLEQANDVGEGATKANSGILYPGFHPRGGSLKGISCVEGNRMYDSICVQLGIPMKKIGSLYVAFHHEGEEMLEEKFQKGKKNGTPGMEIISGEEARVLEPQLSREVTRALYAPTTGIISPFQLILAVTHSALKNGVEFCFGTKVTGLQIEPEGAAVFTTKGDFQSSYIVNAAGGNAMELEGWIYSQDLVIKPRRGQYYLFDKQGTDTIHHVIYQAQETDEGGTLIAPTIEGNLIAGPTSEDVSGYNRVETTKEGLLHIERVAKKLLPGLDMGNIITNFAGIRANIKNLPKEQKDFFLRVSGVRMVSALGIKNPGMTAAPYLAQETISLLQTQGLKLEPKFNFKEYLEPQRPFLQLTPHRQRELLQQDSRYGRVICRCEGITEGDIVAALHDPIPPSNLNGLKKRLRVGMGRCQGGYCTLRIIEIVSRELGCAPCKVEKGLAGSNLIKGWVKK